MSWYTLPSNVPWLTLVLVVPLVGALLIALTPSIAGRVIKQLGILTSVIGGYLFSISLLYPLRRIADEVNEISARNLTRRVRSPDRCSDCQSGS